MTDIATPAPEVFVAAAGALVGQVCWGPGGPASASRGEADVFAPFMVNAWVVATIVAVVAGVVGFFP